MQQMAMMPAGNNMPPQLMQMQQPQQQPMQQLQNGNMVQAGHEMSAAEAASQQAPPPAPPPPGSGVGGSQASSDAADARIWEKNRRWKATLPEGEFIPLVKISEPFAPGSQPREDVVLKLIENGDIVRQTGHSKKTKGFMVMPVLALAKSPDEQDVEGFVTRRSIDKTRDDGDILWFEEIVEKAPEEGDKGERRDRWKAGRASREASGAS